MPEIKIGSSVGNYEILSLLGKGGFGEVYRARDKKLKREVAIKVLPEEFSRDGGRVDRFQREAEVLASLNHPNIGGIYDLEEERGSRFLVLELVPGETLAERIAKAPLRLDEALDIAKQTCTALEAAHEKGITHRDLKPANVKITPEGKVKLLDFGLAHVYEAEATTDLANSPTLVSRSIPGIILGTAAYMSPEQARGKPVDKRADVWAFGCVLYEMLTSRQLFKGETLSDMIVSILSTEPDWSALPERTPSRLRQLIKRCLQKDATRRLRDIGDAALEIDDILKEPDVPVSAGPASVGVDTRQRRRFSSLSAILALTVVVLSVALIRVVLTNKHSLTWSGTFLGGPRISVIPRISPDGRLLLFQTVVDADAQVAVMNPSSGDWTVLTRDRSHGYISDESWSQDGSRIYYGRTDGLPRGVFTVPALGGDEKLVLEDAGSPVALPDGSLMVLRLNESHQSQIYRFWPDSSRLEAYPAFSPGGDQSQIRSFHDGKEILFWGRSGDQSPSDTSVHLYAMDVLSKKSRQIVTDVQLAENASVAIGHDDRSILALSRLGNAARVVRVPRKGGPAEILFSTLQSIYGLDEAPDGAIYVDQAFRPTEVLRIKSPGALPDALLRMDTYATDTTMPPLSDGRVVVATYLNGRSRLALGRAGSDPRPFLQTNEDTSGPVAMINENEIAFIMGSGKSAGVAIGSLSDGRILRRLSNVDGAYVFELGFSPDGKTLYLCTPKGIMSVPAQGGEPRLLHQGGSFAIDPRGKYLIVQFNDREGVRLVRVSLEGKPDQPVAATGFRLALAPLSPNAVRADGAIVKALALGDSFNWALGLIHPDNARIERVPLDSSIDVHQTGFLADGQIMVLGYLFDSSLWRFRPAS